MDITINTQQIIDFLAFLTACVTAWQHIRLNKQDEVLKNVQVDKANIQQGQQKV